MAASSIKNPSVEVCAMPYPFQGILKGGQTIILPYTPAQLDTLCPSIANALEIEDLGSYAGDNDEATYGPVSEAAQEFESLAIVANAGTSGVQSALSVTGAADTGVTASTEQTDVYFNLARTVTWATGALTNQRAVRIAAPTYAFAAASTITNASTLYVSDAPAAGANATITNNYALFVDAGRTRLGGAVICGDALDVAGAFALAGVQTSTIDDAADAAVTRGLVLCHTTSGTAAAGIGAGLRFRAESDAGTLRNAGAVDALHQDVTDGAEASELVLSAARAGTLLPVAYFGAAAAAVNQMYVSASATGSAVEVRPVGDDANCPLAISGRGTAALQLRDGAGNTLMSVSDAGLAVYADSQLGGAPTINRPAGEVQVNSGASDVTVTNALVTTGSLIFAMIRNTTTNAVSVLRVVPGAGNFNIVLSGDPGVSNAQVAFWVVAQGS